MPVNGIPAAVVAVGMAVVSIGFLVPMAHRDDDWFGGALAVVVASLAVLGCASFVWLVLTRRVFATEVESFFSVTLFTAFLWTVGFLFPIARRNRDLFGVICAAAAALVALAAWFLLGTGVLSASIVGSQDAAQRQRPGDLNLPPPLPPLTAPEPKPTPPRTPPPTIITPAVARGALRRGSRVYVDPSSGADLRRELVQALKRWRRFSVVSSRPAADVEMKIEHADEISGFVSADGTHTTTVTKIALSVRDKRKVLWIGSGSTVAVTFAAFQKALAAADATNAK